MKLINIGGKAANATRLSSIAGKAVPKRLKTQKAANIGKMVVAGAAADALHARRHVFCVVHVGTGG